MPTNQPNNAPDATPPQPRDADTAANVLTDDRLEPNPGGGGLGGTDAGGGSDRAPLGTTRNSPIDVGVATDADADAATEAKLRAGEAGPKEPHPSSL